jgi:GNAT superfamily N-acetyltransferase
MEPKIEIKALNEKNIDEICHLHQRVFPENPASRLGLKALRYMYQAVCDSGYSMGYVCYHDGQIVGVVTGCYDFKKYRRYMLFKYGISFLLISLSKSLLLLSKLSSFVSCAKGNLMYESKEQANSSKKYSACLLTIGVDDNMRGTQAGHLLFDSLVKDFHNRNIYNFQVSTEVDNERAIKFYQKCGFQISKILRNRYVQMVYEDTPSDSTI